MCKGVNLTFNTLKFIKGLIRNKIDFKIKYYYN